MHPYRDAPLTRVQRWRARGWLVPVLGIPVAVGLAAYVLSLREPRSASAQVPQPEPTNVPPARPPLPTSIPLLQSPVESRVEPPVESAAPKPEVASAVPTKPGHGSLFIDTSPRSNCVVDGVAKGQTPMTLRMAAGAHVVTCVAVDGDDVLKNSSSAIVKPGETSKVVMKLRL